VLWSPSGASAAALREGPLEATGALEARFAPGVAESPAEVADPEAVLIALPAYGHRAVIDVLAPHLREGRPVIFSSHASFGALYLARLLAARGVSAPLIAWGTTVVTGRRTGPASVAVNTVRAKVDLCALPPEVGPEALTLCAALFGDRFVPREGLLAIQLSNLNPQNHMGIALANMTRMEHGEAWSQGANVTPNVGRLLEALDAERLAIAGALGLEVRTILQHFSLSFHVPEGPVAEMNAAMHAAGRGGTGPATADSRYVTEDVPFGLWPTVVLGRMAGAPAPLHEAGVRVFSAMYGRDFAAENDLLAALDLEARGLDALRAEIAGRRRSVSTGPTEGRTHLQGESR
jgi:opine dehydrogenase